MPDDDDDDDSLINKGTASETCGATDGVDPFPATVARHMGTYEVDETADAVAVSCHSRKTYGA